LITNTLATEKSYNLTELLAHIAEGDQQAFTLFFHRYQKKLLTVSKLYLKTDALAEEALQEIFMKVWINRSKLREVKDVEAWLFILTRNYLIRYLEQWARNKAAERSWNAEQMRWTADDPAVYARYQQILLSAINTLSPQQKAVFCLSKEEQLSHKQIGERLSLSPLTVKTHLQRAMQQIRQYLSDHPVEPALFLACAIFFL
jgi:RNA polymerase sigma-70 factor (family 1)